jgi:hypothetical protein
LNNKWGIGFDISTITGILRQSTRVNFSGRKEFYEAESSNDGEGLGQIHLSIGVRYYIK